MTDAARKCTVCKRLLAMHSLGELRACDGIKSWRDRDAIDEMRDAAERQQIESRLEQR